MDERTPTGISRVRFAALSIIALVSAACETPTMAPAVGPFKSDAGGFSCVLPGEGWRRRLNFPESHLSIRHDDVDNAWRPDIDVSESKSHSKEELEAFRVGSLKVYEGDPTYKAMPLRSVKIDGRTAWVDDEIYMNALAATMHRKHGDPAFTPILYRKTTVYLSGPKKSYAIKFSSPVSLYDKHRPAFDQLLASFKFAD